MVGMPATRAVAVPLDAARLRAALVSPGAVWTDVLVSERTGSTNSDVLVLAAGGAPEGLIVATERQTLGRGRQGRQWESLPGGALTFSLLLRPGPVPPVLRGWVPLLAGVATAAAVRHCCAVEASLKWPNDVMVGDRKLAGLLAEQAGDSIVVGIGLNVLGQPADLPVPTATSLELNGAARTDRNDLLAGILHEFGRWYQDWCAADGDPEKSGLRAGYLERCATVGRTVRVALPGGQSVTGLATDIDGTGRLVVRDEAGRLVPVSAGDVIHVR
jgi:BirA family biotin operon repressor/biotin-[acetyl-CoA-carboxylase] ligase